MKAAAPQAPTTTQHTAAKTGAKRRSASAASTDAAAFAGALAKAVAAKAAGAATGAVRPAAAAAAAPRRTAVREAATTAAAPVRIRRTDEAAVGRAVAEAVAGRAAGALPAAAVPADAAAAARPAARQRENPRLQVTDLRRRPAAVSEAARGAEPKPQHASARSVEPAQGDGTAAAKPYAARRAPAETDARAAASARAAPLARIREMTGSDLVRTVGLVVRDGGGEIRLSLKPESLGGVRIRLRLEDGKIEGRIVVDTPEARQAFEAGLDDLTRALQADGFQTGSLAVTVSGDGANDSRQAAGLLGDAIAEARRRASDEALSAAVPPAGWDGGGDGLVNVFA